MEEKLYKATASRNGNPVAEDVFKCAPDKARSEITRRARIVVPLFGGGRYDRVDVVPYRGA